MWPGLPVFLEGEAVLDDARVAGGIFPPAPRGTKGEATQELQDSIGSFWPSLFDGWEEIAGLRRHMTRDQQAGVDEDRLANQQAIMKTRSNLAPSM